MMDIFASPVILFFALGVAASWLRSDLTIPEAVAKGMSLYLMTAIGLKGGVEVAESRIGFDFLAAASAGLALSFLLPIVAFAALRALARLDRTNAASVAAHYGSVSVVTFVAGSQMLDAGDMPPAGYMVAVLALMETPAILTGLFLARAQGGFGGMTAMLRNGTLHEVLTNGPVLLLAGSFLIGLLIGKQGFEPISPLFVAGFQGVLCLFLLDMGLIAMRRLMKSRALNARLIAVGIILPVVNGTIGVAVAAALGLDPGSVAALGILAASASYIAVPAAMRMALPEADPGISLSMSLGITFPFNIVLGIPLYAWLATTLGGL